MAHWAEVDENNIVMRVIVTSNDDPNEGYDWIMENLGGRWLKTSYNANIRGKFATPGDRYVPASDIFVHESRATPYVPPDFGIIEE